MFSDGRLTWTLSLATGEPDGVLWRVDEHDYSPDNLNSARVSATLLSLVRNEELEDLLPTMRDLERTWNHKFNYPWTFLNDKPFTEEFKKRTQAETKAECIYGAFHTGRYTSG
jgi:mannosyltransferase